MENEPLRMQFSVRQNWRGKFILRVHHFENFPASGQWQDAEPRHIPEFFRRLLVGTPKEAMREMAA